MTRAHATPILLDAGNRAHLLEAYRIEKNSAQDEKWLQRLIHDHPECLPIAEIEPRFEGAISVCMEMQSGHGPIDNLLLTSNGDIVIVETKLWKNPEARRTVIAQALDYAACIFDMDFEELEQRALKADFGSASRPERLYDLFGPSAEKSLAVFIETVEANLRQGRALILVVGDGIRNETERLSQLVQSHAGARFTFALVELAVFKVPNGALLVCPRTLAQTRMLERGVVRIEDHRVRVLPSQTPAATSPTLKPIAQSITAEEFFEAMAVIRPDLPERLRSFLLRLQEPGVRADFQRSLHLRWETPQGRTINLGYISRNGELWTDTIQLGIPTTLATEYLQDLAGAFGANLTSTTSGKQYLKFGARSLRVSDITDKFDRWRDAILAHIGRLERSPE